MKIRTGLVAVSIALLGTTAMAQPRHYHRYGHGVRTVVVKPAATAHVVNRMDKNDRLAMAVAYIKDKGTITARKYAKITGLARTTAEAELEVFANDKRCPVVRAASSRKSVYTLRG